MAKRVIVFDVNETLLNIRHLEPVFQRAFGDRAAMKEWFSVLLLHTEVATLAGPYFDFGALALAAFEMTAAARKVSLSPDDKQQLKQGMLLLPPLYCSQLGAPAIACTAAKRDAWRMPML